MDTKKESTSQRLAKQYNVSEKTIKRDAEFAEGIGMLAPELKKDILGGKVKVKKVDIQQLSQLETVVQPIQSIAEVNLLIAASNVVTEQKISKQSTEVALLKTKIKATVDQITTQNANSLMAELEQLLNELKNGLSIS
jgi:predicted DNA-binding transcriptional regulator YafY